MSEIFTYNQKECLRLLKDYVTDFAMHERWSHECKYHNDEHACRMAKFVSEEMERIKEEAEACGWTPTRILFTAGGIRHAILKKEEPSIKKVLDSALFSICSTLKSSTERRVFMQDLIHSLNRKGLISNEEAEKYLKEYVKKAEVC